MGLFEVEAPGRQLHKFGGSSLADRTCYLRVAGIIQGYSQRDDLIVVSAAGDTTNQLINWLNLSQRDRPAAQQAQQTLQAYHTDLISSLLSPEVAGIVVADFNHDLERLAKLVDKPVTEAIYAEVVGHGEIWSARLMAALLRQQGERAEWVDARSFLSAERAIQPQVDENLSRPRLQQILAEHADQRLVITGFIAGNQAGETVLLGRNGSDYSATQTGALAGVARVIIWSDVAGVYSADPRKVPEATLLPLLRLDEASELARLGASVLHTRTLQPVATSEMALQLRGSHTDVRGFTCVERIPAPGTGGCIVTSHDDICLIELQVSAAHDFIQLQKRVDRIFQRAQLLPLVVGVHSDRHLLQFCYTAEVANSALHLLAESGLSGELRMRQKLALVAVVGAGVTRNPLHCSRFWQQLQGQPVEFSWQSPEGISLVAVLRTDSTASLVQALHHALFCNKKRVGVVLFGLGALTSRWLELFKYRRRAFFEQNSVEFILTGIVDNGRSLLSYGGLDSADAYSRFDNEAQEQDAQALIRWLSAHPYDDLVVLDMTDSEQLAEHYYDFAHFGFHVISANQRAAAGNRRYYLACDEFKKTGCHWLSNATVGAALPVNYAIRDLINSGDTFWAVSGVFSSALSWIFGQFDGQIPFTKLVEQARSRGLMANDPREALSGKVVMRQLVILAREAGYPLNEEHVSVESLLPAACQEESVDSFFLNSQALDKQMLQRLNAARLRGRVLRYVARFDMRCGCADKVSVGLEEIEKRDPLATLLPGENIFIINTSRYRDNPLIIRGLGSGDDITVGAIFADMNRLVQLL